MSKKSPNTDSVVLLTLFRVIWDFFDTLSTLRAGRPGNTFFWTVANGGVANGGLKGVSPPFLEIGRNRPFSAFFAVFRRVRSAPRKSRKRRKKGLFPQISSDLLEPPSLEPPFAGLQFLRLFGDFGSQGLGTPVHGGFNRKSKVRSWCTRRGTHQGICICNRDHHLQ